VLSAIGIGCLGRTTVDSEEPVSDGNTDRDGCDDKVIADDCAEETDDEIEEEDGSTMREGVEGKAVEAAREVEVEGTASTPPPAMEGDTSGSGRYGANGATASEKRRC